MNEKALPTPRSFKTYAKQWQIQVSLCPFPTLQITFEINSRKPSQIEYKETFYTDSLPQQIKETYFKEVYDLYMFLQREHQRSIKIYDFVPEIKVLRFAHREAKKVFSLKMKMFADGVEQVEWQNVRQSNRYSTNPYRMTMQQSRKKEEVITEAVKQQPKPSLAISQVLHQPPKQPVKQFSAQIQPNPSIQFSEQHQPEKVSQTLDHSKVKVDATEQNKDLDYFEDFQESQVQKPQVKFTEQEEIDYDKWINTIEDNDSLVFPSKKSLQQQSDEYFVNDAESSNSYDLQSNIIKSDIYQMDQDEDILASVQKDNGQRQAIDMKSIVKENVQIRHERDQLIQRVALLEEENKQLKEKIHQFQMNLFIQPKINSVHSYPNLAQSMQAPQSIWSHINNANSADPYSSNLNPTSSNPLVGFINPTPFFQMMHSALKVGDEKPQQNFQTKRRYHESSFAKYFNSKFDVSYKEFTLNDFEENFFTYDWPHVEILTLDGNLLKTEGFDKVIQNFGSNLKEISAGNFIINLAYNGITDVRNLQFLPNVKKVDLRANPLSQNTKSYLEWLKGNAKIQVLL